MPKVMYSSDKPMCVKGTCSADMKLGSRPSQPVICRVLEFWMLVAFLYVGFLRGLGFSFQVSLG